MGMHANEGSALLLKEKEKKENFFFAGIEVSLSFLGEKNGKKKFHERQERFWLRPLLHHRGQELNLVILMIRDSFVKEVSHK